MGKLVGNDVLDGALNVIRNSGNLMVVLPSEPASFAAAQAAKLAEVSMSSGDFTLADGDTSGRKVTVAAKSGISVGASGTATHIGILDTSGSRLLYVTTCASQVLSTGGAVSLAAWAIEIRDPS